MIYFEGQESVFLAKFRAFFDRVSQDVGIAKQFASISLWNWQNGGLMEKTLAEVFLSSAEIKKLQAYNRVMQELCYARGENRISLECYRAELEAELMQLGLTEFINL